MVSFLLDFLHAFHVIAGPAYLFHSLLWNDALACPACADEQFYLEPYIGFMGVRPYCGHFWQRVALYHDSDCSSASSIYGSDGSVSHGSFTWLPVSQTGSTLWAIHFKEESIRLCHPECSEGSLAGQRSFAALRMTIVKRHRFTSFMFC